MRTFLVLVLCVALLVSCGAPPQTAQSIVAQMQAAGLEVENPHTPQFKEGSPFPRSFSDGLVFDMPSYGLTNSNEPHHGSVLVCDTKKNCDAIYAYYDALKGLLGPYYWQSKSGTVVAYLDSIVPAPTAAKYEAIITALP
jgi:hypothetical protein